MTQITDKEFTNEQKVLIACANALLVWDMLTDDSKEAVICVEKFVEGKATQEEMRIASSKANKVFGQLSGKAHRVNGTSIDYDLIAYEDYNSYKSRHDETPPVKYEKPDVRCQYDLFVLSHAANAAASATNAAVAMFNANDIDFSVTAYTASAVQAAYDSYSAQMSHDSRTVYGMYNPQQISYTEADAKRKEFRQKQHDILLAFC